MPNTQIFKVMSKCNFVPKAQHNLRLLLEKAAW